MLHKKSIDLEIIKILPVIQKNTDELLLYCGYVKANKKLVKKV